jgi:type III pantothenate kinase
MILVDIGNSGLRAARAEQIGLGKTVERSEIFKLSWSSIGKEILKHQPRRSSIANHRWVDPNQHEGFRWLVSQLHQFTAKSSPTIWRIASVNRTALEALEQAIEDSSRGDLVQIVGYRHCGIDVEVDFPDRVGIDRILAARAALAWKSKHGYPHSPIIVVQAGTALTVDWVSSKGAFQGGAILPGVGLALQYLAAGTDQLPWLPTESIDSLPPLPGKNTEQAIAAGVHASLVGGAKYIIERYRLANQAKSDNPIPVIISGGDGRLVQEHICAPVAYVENLVLLGLSLCQIP